MKNKESLTNIVIKNSFYNFITTLLNRIGAIIFTIIIARVLLPESFGIYNLSISITFIVLTFSDLGINATLIRYVSNSLAQKNIKKASSYFHYLVKLKFSLLIFSSVLLLILSYPLSNFIFHKPELTFPLIFLAFYLIILGIEEFYSALFFAFNKLKYRSYRELIFQFLRLIFFIIILFLIARTHYILGIIFSLILATLLVFIVVLFWIKKINSLIFKKSNFEIDKKKLLKFISYLAIVSISVIFFYNIDTIMLGAFIPSASYVGFYKVAFSLVLSIAGLLTFSNLLLPAFSRVTKRRLNFSFNRVVKYTTIFSVPAAFGLAILGKYFIRAIYGYEYLPATLPLYFLAFIIIESSLTGSYNAVLTSKGKPKLYAKMLVSATILNIILNLILILSLIKISSIWATTGAAIATFLSRYFYLIGLIYISKKHLNLKIDKPNILKPFFASIIMAIILLIIVIGMKDMTLLTGFLTILLGAAIYFILLLLIKGISIKDFALIKNLLSFSNS